MKALPEAVRTEAGRTATDEAGRHRGGIGTALVAPAANARDLNRTAGFREAHEFRPRPLA